MHKQKADVEYYPPSKYMTIRKPLAVMILIVAGVMSVSTQAATLLDTVASREHSASEKRSIGLGEFGDQTDLATGVTHFTVTDVDIPTNSQLRIRLGRKFDMTSVHSQLSSGEDYMYEGSTDPTQLKKQVFGGGWELDIPAIRGVFDLRSGWVSDTNLTGLPNNNRCSGGFAPPRTVSGVWPNYYTQIPARVYWGGTKINIPHLGEETLLSRISERPKPNGAEVYTGSTRSEWMVSCLPAVTGALGEGFKVRVPDGTTYYFDWMVVRRVPSISSEETVSLSYTYDGGRLGVIGGTTAAKTLVPRGEYALYATKVEDRFGNWLKYEYDPANPHRLMAIRSNDGASVSLTYQHGQIHSVASGSRTWTYEYHRPSAPTFNDRAYLTAVVLPDQSRWQLSYPAGGTYFHASEGKEMWRGCNLRIQGMASEVPPDPSRVYTINVVHPSGATGVFKFRNIVHGTNRTPGQCFANNPNASATIQDAVMAFVAPSLYEKTVSGPGLASQKWSISFSPSWSWKAACTSGNCANSSETRVTSPDGVLERYTFGNDYDANAGQLLSLKIEVGGITKKHTSNSYLTTSNGQSFSDSYGVDPHLGNNPFANKIRPLIATRITQDASSFDTTVDTCASANRYCFDAFGRATRLVEGNTLQSSRTNSTEYFDDFNLWVIGQIRRELSGDSTVVSQIEYNAQSLPWRVYRYGKLRGTTNYHADGNVANIIDGRGNVTSLSNWKRSVPQSIKFPITNEAPLGATRVANVSDDGWIATETDETGAKTCYSYDAMGRVSSITYPSETLAEFCDSSRWAPAALSFAQISTDEHGLAPGHWRSSRYEGNKHVNTYFDALWREVLVEVLDYSDISGTLSQVVKRYDSNGRLSFQSYPQRAVGGFQSVNQGTRTFYDALGRVVRTEQDSEQNVLSTSTEYLDGLRMRVTNPRGGKTITGFMAWGQPSYEFPIANIYPEGKVVTVDRHPVFGWPLAVTQRSADYSVQQTRRYVYDGNAQLCKTIEPEVGVTVRGYDFAGNLSWSASGLPQADYASTTDCNYAAANASGRVVARTYDARNRLTALNFPDGLGDQLLSYERDGLPEQVTTFNRAGNAHSVVNRYAYNKRRLLTSEFIEQPLSYSWRIGYDYDAIGHRRWQSYPTGLVLDFAPNALGQPTQVRDQQNIAYATNASYHPNGALKNFTYGNGILYSMTQNARQLPAEMKSTGIHHDQYGYDENGNITEINDRLQGLGYSMRTRTMSYDNLDRLTGSGAGVFGGSDNWHRFTYDALDNLKSWKLTGVKDYASYVYDAQNRLTNVRNSLGLSQVNMGYDEQGNLATKDGLNFHFDHGNRLRSASSGTESYRYDALGRRVQAARTDGSTSLWMYANNGQMLFSWDGPTREKTQENLYLAGKLVATVTHDWPSNAVIATRYQHTDALGSPIAVSDAVGQLVERNEYEPFGSLIAKPNFTGIGFSGHVTDGQTGLSYMQQRYYDPSVGRFLSTDPVAANSTSGANFNRYWYANNNPYRFVDPDGRFSVAATASFGFAASFNTLIWRAQVTYEHRVNKEQQARSAQPAETAQEFETITIRGTPKPVPIVLAWKYGDANPPDNQFTPDQADIYRRWHQRQTLNTLVYPTFRGLPKAISKGNPLRGIPGILKDAYDSGRNMERLVIPSQADIDAAKAAER